MAGAQRQERVFKTAWFAKAARKAQIGDEELCAAVAQARDGKCDDLGNGVYKKRVSGTSIAASFWRREADTGCSRICSRKKTAPMSMLLN